MRTLFSRGIQPHPSKTGRAPHWTRPLLHPPLEPLCFSASRRRGLAPDARLVQNNRSPNERVQLGRMKGGAVVMGDRWKIG
jgi:hypothetical protein